jgi:hypothetical protein
MDICETESEKSDVETIINGPVNDGITDSIAEPMEVPTSDPPVSEKTATMYYRQLSSLWKRLSTFIQQIPVLGFNSGKYDLNAVKRGIASALGLPECDTCDQFVVKRGNSYVCLANE